MSKTSRSAIYLDDFETPGDEMSIQLRLLEAERDRWRILAGGGCDANDGGEHDIMSRGDHQYCGKCGESVSSTKDRILNLVNKNIQLESSRVNAERRAEAAEARCSQLEAALNKSLTAAILSQNRQ